MAIAIAVESPLQSDVRALIDALDAYLRSIDENGYFMTAAQLAEPNISMFVARDSGKAVACGALRRHDGGIGEVKRMYTKPAYQGMGIGGCILDAIIDLARQEGFSRMVLETGHQHPWAWHVYERAGFKRCGPVLDYPDVHWSVFYQKELERAPA